MLGRFWVPSWEYWETVSVVLLDEALYHLALPNHQSLPAGDRVFFVEEIQILLLRDVK
jgi:hypothetical protein